MNKTILPWTTAMTKLEKKVSNFNFATSFHSFFPMQKNNTRTCMFRYSNFCKSMYMYLSTMLKKDFHKKQITKERKKTGSYVSIEVQLKKPQQPNWEHIEILTFINAKWDEHIIGLDKVDP
jgi:hypothetical protein